jgi:hypothetical protein
MMDEENRLISVTHRHTSEDPVSPPAMAGLRLADSAAKAALP